MGGQRAKMRERRHHWGGRQVALWMSNVHMAIEELIKKHAIRKIETRGDCYIVVAGCGAAEGDLSGCRAPAPSRALHRCLQHLLPVPPPRICHLGVNQV